MTSALRQAAAARARRVTRRLETRGLPGLGEALARLRGCPIGGRWRIDTLYAVGAEGAVFTTEDVGAPDAPPTVVKIPLLPYHRPADISSSMLRHRRAALREEASYLARSASPFMPRDQGLHEFSNPLLETGRGGPFAEADPALVMERLPGLDVDLWLARIHRSGLSPAILRERLDTIAIMLLDALRDLEARGFFYADLRPGNLRVTGRPERRLRLLDAGSLVEVGDTSGRFPHVPHYLPPDLFERRYMRGLPIVPSSAAQAVMAGRTLYEIATGCVPMPGRPLEIADLRDSAVSPVVADAIDGLGSGSFSSVVSTLKYIHRNRSRPIAPLRASPASLASDRAAPALAAAPGAPAVPPLPAAPPDTALTPLRGIARAPSVLEDTARSADEVPLAEASDDLPAPIAARLSASAARPSHAAAAPPRGPATRPAAEVATPEAATSRPPSAPRGFWRRLLDRATPWRSRRNGASAAPRATIHES